jgi:aspartyl-tRNA(Asn)/glutamyl-tRNA(Gln) amidotransferase subunit C
MPSLTPTQVQHIATLARLDVADAELQKYATELSAILKYIDMLTEVDTSKVTATAQVTGLENSMRTDQVWAQPIATPDALLATSPLPITDHQIATHSAHG